MKVQRPGVEREFRLDLRTLIFFTQFAMPWCVKQLEEIEHQFETEFDYRLEAENLREAYENSKEWRSKIVIPRPFEEFTTGNVLTMELLHGRKFLDVIETRWRKLGERFGLDEEVTVELEPSDVLLKGRNTSSSSTASEEQNQKKKKAEVSANDVEVEIAIIVSVLDRRN